MTALMDAAWVCAKESAGLYARQIRQAMRTELSDQFPTASRAEINYACTAARDLLAACYNIGDACRNDAISHDEAQHQLAEQLPGFGPEVYAEAVTYGMFVSR